MQPSEILTKLSFYVVNRRAMAQDGKISTTAPDKSTQHDLNMGMAMAYLDVLDFLNAKGVQISTNICQKRQ